MSWKFLDTRCHELLKEDNSNTGIARILIKEFKLNAEVNTIRMYVSKQRKLLSKDIVEKEDTKILDNKDRVPFLQKLYHASFKKHIVTGEDDLTLDEIVATGLQYGIVTLEEVLQHLKPVQPASNTTTIPSKESTKPGVNPSKFHIKMPDTFGKITPTDWDNTPQSHLHNMYGNHVDKDVSGHIKSIINKPNPQLHLILGCIHVPFENKILLNKIFQLVRDNKFTSINLIGDVIDCTSISSYSANSLPIDGLTLEDEYKSGIKLLENFFRYMTGDDTIVNIIPGNHENRVIKYNQDIKNAKTPVLSFNDYLKVHAKDLVRTWNLFDDSIQIGSYELIHGIYFNEYPSKKHLNVFRKNMVFAHTHRIGNAIESNIQVHNIGWLGNVESNGFSYANPGMKQTWRNGFGILVIDGKNEYFHQITCDNNSFYFNGKSY